MEKLYKIYPGSRVFKLKLIENDTNIKPLTKVYGFKKATFIMNQFQKDAVFYMDEQLLTDEYNNFYMYIHKIKINKNQDQVELSLILDQNIVPLKNKRNTPIPYNPSRIHSSMILTPLYLNATFEVINGMPRNDDAIYGDSIIHEYYEQLQQEGGKKVTKQYLIDLCRKHKIPYSGRTKAELMVALRK
jgi:hypothetical protein